MPKKNSTGKTQGKKGSQSPEKTNLPYPDVEMKDLSTILENFPEFIYISDIDTHEVLFVNRKYQSLLKNVEPGMKCYELLKGFTEQCELCTNDIIRKTGLPHVWDGYNEHLGRQFLNTDQIISWHDGRKVRFETSIDITDQKKIEALLQASESKYRSFIEQSAYGFFILNMKEEVTYLNKVAREIYGIGEKDPVRLKISDLLNPDEYETAVKNIQNFAAGKNPPNSSVYTIRRQDGIDRTVEIQTFPIWREERLHGFHGTVIDITDRVNAEKLLREKSEFLDAVINNTSDGIFVVDEDIRYVLINPASGRILGHDPKEWVGKLAGTNKHPDDERSATEAFMRAVNGENVTCEVRVKAKDDTYHLLEIRYTPMILNEKFHLLGMVSDITEKRKAEDALKDSEQRLRDVGDNLPEGAVFRLVHLSEKFTRFDYVSQGIESLFGIPSSELYEDAKPLFKMFHSGDHESVRTGEKEARMNERMFTTECRFILKDGTVKWIQWRAKATLQPSGMVIWDGVCFDITSRKKFEATIQENEEKYRQLFELSPESIMLLDTAGNIIEFNKATLALFKMDPEKILGRKIPEICELDQNEQDYLAGVLESVLGGSRVEHHELEFHDSEGANRWIEAFPSLVTRGSGKHSVQVIARDITLNKQREYEMKRKYLRFASDGGNVYLSKDTLSSQATEAFDELLRAGYSGTMITREQKNDSQRKVQSIFRYVKISDVLNPALDKYRPQDICDLLSGLPRREAVLITCLEYCISRLGIKKVVSMMQDLRDLAEVKRLTVIMSLDPSVIQASDLRKLELETKPLTPQSESIAKLPDALGETLRFIAERNNIGVKPTYSDIGAKFKISKPTVRTRLRTLIENRSVVETQKGREKTLEITESGKRRLGF